MVQDVEVVHDRVNGLYARNRHAFGLGQLEGEPRYVSTSIGRFAEKSWYMVLLVSLGFSIV